MDDVYNLVENAQECSIGGTFYDLLNKRFYSKKEESVMKFGDNEGSDFKRLLHKSNTMKRRRTNSYHQDSPDFRPIIYVNNTTSSNSSHQGFSTRLYSLFFHHEDRYFNHDRDELSKDIFPVE